MTHSVKKRGRPLGSQIDDDSVLSKVADRLISNKTMKPTKAMRLESPCASEAEIRRWQSKWRERQHNLLTRALERAEAKKVNDIMQQPTKAKVVSIKKAYDLFGDSLSTKVLSGNGSIERMKGLFDNSAERAARGLFEQNDLYANAVKAAGGLSSIERIKELFESRAERAARGLFEQNDLYPNAVKVVGGFSSIEPIKELFENSAPRAALGLEYVFTFEH